MFLLPVYTINYLGYAVTIVVPEPSVLMFVCGGLVDLCGVQECRTEDKVFDKKGASP